MMRTTSTRARSLRALTTAAALCTLGLTGSAALADGPRHGSHATIHQTGHSYEKCSRCDRWDEHRHDDGGVLWIGGNRFGMSDRPGAIEDFAGELRRAGYRVLRSGNTLRISSRHDLGGLSFSPGKFRAVITTIDRCTVSVQLFQVVCEPVVVKPFVRPVFRPVVVRPSFPRPGFGHGRDRHDRGDRWDRDRRDDDCRDSRTVISFRW